MKDAQLFVIGKKVKEALVKSGFNNIMKTFDSTTSLLKFIHKKNSYNKIKFEYLCGSVVNDKFVNEMKMKKYSLRKRVVYQVTPFSQLFEKTQIALKNKRIEVVVFYSIYSAKVFLKLLRKHDLLLLIKKNVKFLCFSERISHHLDNYKVIPKQNMSSIKSPNSHLLLKSLKKILNSR